MAVTPEAATLNLYCPSGSDPPGSADAAAGAAPAGAAAAVNVSTNVRWSPDGLAIEGAYVPPRPSLTANASGCNCTIWSNVTTSRFTIDRWAPVPSALFPVCTETTDGAGGLYRRRNWNS